MLAEVAHLDAGRWVTDDTFGRFGREDLTAVRDSRYPGCPVDVEARQAVADALGLAGVQAHPHTTSASSGHGSVASARCPATAAATADFALSNTTKKESPSVLSS